MTFAPKPRRCKVCKGRFMPRNSFHAVCSAACSIAALKDKPDVIDKSVKKQWGEEKRAMKEKGKTTQDWLQLLQIVFNKWIRLRDAHLPCISCDTTKDVQYCAGHYYTRGAFPNLRVDPDNVHKQCNKHCNLKLSGNIVNYRPRLIERIGQERFDALEARKNDVFKPTLPEIKELISLYKDKIKELEKQEKTDHV